VRRREDGAFLGRCGIKRSVETAEHELLYAYRQAFWRQGYAVESAAAVLQHTCSLGVPLVIACAVPENTASIAVMQRIGMSFSRRAQMYGQEMVVYLAERAAGPGPL
jgi:ribosomal-protein-alanine N-acetyltransferase